MHNDVYRCQPLKLYFLVIGNNMLKVAPIMGITGQDGVYLTELLFVEDIRVGLERSRKKSIMSNKRLFNL